MEDVRRWLERSRELGFLGPGPVDDHVEHALGFAEVVGEEPEAVVDLGSGGGIPGLVLAGGWQATSFVLLDSNERRTAFLREAVAALGWVGRVEVLRLRAELAGRDGGLRGRFSVVVARSFGAPPVTAECAAPLLRIGGRLVVSEPPGDVERWPTEGLGLVGLRMLGRFEARGAGFVVHEQVEACPDRYPRREGVPAKRPLW